jgi:hypothetical protein
MTEILLKVVLNTITLNLTPKINPYFLPKISPSMPIMIKKDLGTINIQ